MAILASPAGMALHVGGKSIHPFFEKRLKTLDSPLTNAHGHVSTTSSATLSITTRSEDESAVGRERERTRSAASQTPPTTPLKPNRSNINNMQSELLTIPQLMDTDPNYGRRKRVKSLSPEVGQSGMVEDGSSSTSLDLSVANGGAKVVPTSSRVLRLNPKTGTIGSPPRKKSTRLTAGVCGKGNSRKAIKQTKCLIVKIKYGPDAKRWPWIGQKIGDVLGSTQSMSKGSKPPHLATAQTATAAKSTHPFFVGKKHRRASALRTENENVEKILEEPKHSPQKKMMTLGEARTHSPRKKPAQGTTSSAFSNFGKMVKTTKHPGAVEPCWPPKSMCHVRGLTEPTLYPLEVSYNIPFLAESKSKYASIEIPGAEDILKIMAKNLGIADVLRDLKSADGNDFAQPDKCLRVPEKRFESGLQVQRRVRREIITHMPISPGRREDLTSSEDELQLERTSYPRINAALEKIYGLIPNQLTAFDRSECETQSWAQKYAPCAASDVLQCGREALILKDWLQALMVVSVDKGATESCRGRAGSVTSRVSTISTEKPRKKRRRTDQLKGFLVSSDEDEDDDLNEVSDREAELSMQRGKPPIKTVLRSGNLKRTDTCKVRNAVVISGPNGCGKTAMVYAVAKELSFEVFEINASSRRSGKEIMERVGDMTRNHLVQHSHNPSLSGIQSEDIAKFSDNLEAELNSGRQGTMKNFFKPKKTTDSTGGDLGASKANKEATENDLEKPLKRSPRTQKQSLILLEEVDILFEEDKQFWTTVMSLIVQSKRPVIMTCNDENVVPLQSLPLHAIIRPTPPPSDVATDYMLLVAAAEGHIVRRKAVKSLYEARGHDLRASMAELNYWCQLGVGDCKGGLDWLYPRWPPGCDVDGKGNTIRVMSEGTYKTGMGWLGRDFTFERFCESEVKEEIIRQTWDGWNIDIEDYNPRSEGPSISRGVSGANKLKLITSYEEFAASMSLADSCAAGSLVAGNQILLDKTAPPLLSKSRDDFVIGYELLEAETLDCFDAVHKKISLWIQTQARELINSPNLMNGQQLSESQVTSKIAGAGSKGVDCITRKDFSLAFDPIAEAEKSSVHYTSLECSVFDRTTSIIAEDVAPYVRSIVAYDAKLQQERTRLGNLLSEGGRKGKRLRTTRSALSALEGGPRKNTRRENYFRVPLNTHLVRNTGMKEWEAAVASGMQMGELQVARDESEDTAGMTDSC